jgi:hypothetical protein
MTSDLVNSNSYDSNWKYCDVCKSYYYAGNSEYIHEHIQSQLSVISDSKRMIELLENILRVLKEIEYSVRK